MHDITPDAIVIGVDTHKDVHVAVAVKGLGARRAAASFPVTRQGSQQRAAWAISHGKVYAFGIEGTGSYGAGPSREPRVRGFHVVEVGRVNRRLRRRHGKTDTVDAESAARAVLAGEAEAQAKSGDGAVEMIRHLKIARDTALKARTQAMVTLKTLLVNAPRPLRERFIGIRGKMTLIRAIAASRPGAPVSTTASAKMALRALASRWLMLDAEIKEHEAVLEGLVRVLAPALREAPGVSTGTIADMLVVLGDNPQRIRSEAAFAKLRGVCPVPASSGKTNRHRLNRGGNRRANAALYRVARVRTRHHQPTREYIQRGTAEGKSAREIRRCLKRYIARDLPSPPRLQNPSDGRRQRCLTNIGASTRSPKASSASSRPSSFTALGPWRTLRDVGGQALKWIDWYNNRRLLAPIGYVPPAEAENAYFTKLKTLDQAP